jgi:hypothetical protein
MLIGDIKKASVQRVKAGFLLEHVHVDPRVLVRPGHENVKYLLSVLKG